jgi:hypothetical protein
MIPCFSAVRDLLNILEVGEWVVDASNLIIFTVIGEQAANAARILPLATSGCTLGQAI